MKKILFLLLLVCGSVQAATNPGLPGALISKPGGGVSSTPTPAPTATPQPTPTPVNTATPAPTPTSLVGQNNVWTGTNDFGNAAGISTNIISPHSSNIIGFANGNIVNMNNHSQDFLTAGDFVSWNGAKVGFAAVSSGNAAAETYLTRFAANSMQIIARHLGLSGTPPTLSSCGSSPSSVTGNDTHGHFTTGSGGSLASCTLTFAASYTVAPDCTVDDETTIVSVRGTSSTTTLVVDCTAAGCLASQVIKYICLGN